MTARSRCPMRNSCGTKASSHKPQALPKCRVALEGLYHKVCWFDIVARIPP